MSAFKALLTCPPLAALTLELRLDPRETQWLGPKVGVSGPEGAWEVKAVIAPPSSVPSPRGQGVGYRMTKPREKSSAGCGLVMKLPLCLAPSSHYPREGLLGPWVPHMRMEASQCRAPALPPQPPQDVQGTNPQGKTEA